MMVVLILVVMMMENVICGVVVTYLNDDAEI